MLKDTVSHSLYLAMTYSYSHTHRAVRRPYALTESGMKTMRMPTHQAIAIQIVEAFGWLRMRPRVASTICVTGWCSAKARSHGGMLSTGTNALLAKVNGNCLAVESQPVVRPST